MILSFLYTHICQAYDSKVLISVKFLRGVFNWQRSVFC